LAVAGCKGDENEVVEPVAEPVVETTDESADEPVGELCTDKNTGATLSYEDAVSIAEASECLVEGQLKENHFCNEDTGTWWIDLEAEKPGCNPACVVDLNTGTAEINWRCTGALPPVETEEAVVEPQPAPVIEPTEPITYDYTGWESYTSETYGYSLKYPGGSKVMGANHADMVQFEGPMVEVEYWPILTVDHYDSDFFHPPAGTDVVQYVMDFGMPYDAIDSETAVAGHLTVHLMTEASPMAYGYDEYYFIRGDQLFRIMLLHAGGIQDWDIYNQFLQSFTFEEAVAPAEDTVAGWQGTVNRFPHGFQYKYSFERADGETFLIDGMDDTTNQQIEQVAWNGAEVQLWGNLTEMPGFVSVTRLEAISDPSTATRNLTPFATPEASSELPSDRLGTYHAWSAINGLVETPWCEGAAGPGVGEWLELTFPEQLEVAYLSLHVGYDYSDDIFFKNNRLKRVTFIFSNGEEIEWSFDDERGPQLVPLACAPGPCLEVTSLKIVIDEVYPGSTYDDACIGEIEVWGQTG
jgi:hypothetical protein